MRRPLLQEAANALIGVLFLTGPIETARLNEVGLANIQLRKSAPEQSLAERHRTSEQGLAVLDHVQVAGSLPRGGQHRAADGVAAPVDGPVGSQQHPIPFRIGGKGLLHLAVVALGVAGFEGQIQHPGAHVLGAAGVEAPAVIAMWLAVSSGSPFSSASVSM